MRGISYLRTQAAANDGVRRAGLAACLAVSLFLPGGAFASASYGAALQARDFVQAERAVNAALAADPRDGQALAAKVDILLATAPAARIEEAISTARACVAANPRLSDCREALGNALGTKALQGGIFAALGYAGQIRDAFRAAIELNPQNMSARFSLLQYYLGAPAIVGGGTDPARGLAAETGKLQPEAAPLMQALIALHDGATGQAEQLAQAGAAAPGGLEEQRRDALWAIGSDYLSHGHPADALRVFRALQGRFPHSELGPFGIGRALQEQGRPGDAIAQFEQAAAVYPRAGIYYRLGQAEQATGARAKALAAYEKALALAPPLPSSLQADARAQRDKLKQ